ncbi:hypothetical protein [Dysgonomonas sp. Marseille-Q5470]|uniref:hypothetical protein n=1 Tax=Dysgonomonas sp. Marseille-Q5470 TaxID=3039494 RepID=UPI0024BD0531|nr:hypothetical protein [Dysgonomonas sp. Marseille-Q5470]
MKTSAIKYFSSFLKDAIEMTEKIIIDSFDQCGFGTEEIISLYNATWGGTFSDDDFLDVMNKFDTELQNNILKYDDPVLIMSYMRSAFKDLCYENQLGVYYPFVYTESLGYDDENIIKDGLNVELILNLKSSINKSLAFIEKVYNLNFIIEYKRNLIKGTLMDEDEYDIFDFKRAYIDAEEITDLRERLKFFINKKSAFLIWDAGHDVADFMNRSYDYEFTKKCDIEIERIKTLIETERKYGNLQKRRTLDDVDYKDVTTKLEYAISLINGKDVMDGADYVGPINDPESKTKGYLIIQKLYEENKPIENEIIDLKESGSFLNQDSLVLDRLFNIYNSEVKYLVEYLESEQKINPPKIAFESLLLNCDTKRVCEVLDQLFIGAKGKKAATILLALKNKNYIIIPERDKQKIYNALNERFGLNLTNQSCQKFIVFNNGSLTTPISSEDIKQIENKLP